MENSTLLCNFAHVMKRKMIFICMALLGIVAYAQPRFVADTEILKTGEIQFQKPHTIVFGFTNKGDKPLHIKKVHPSCGCTEVKYTRGNIAPGERGEITAIYDAGILGTFSKYIEVYTNAERDPEFLVFQGRVATEVTDHAIGFPIDLGNVRMSTNYLEFDNVRQGDLIATELKVINVDRAAYRPSLMHLPPYLHAEYKPENIPGGKSGIIRLILDTRQLSSYGLNQTSIYLSRYQGDRIGESNEIVVSAVLLPPTSADTTSTGTIALCSEEVTFGSSNKQGGKLALFGKKGKKMKQVLQVTNNGTAPLNIHALQVFNHAVEASLSSKIIQPGKSAKLTLSVKKSLLGRFKARPRVLLVSDDAQNPVKIVNITIQED